MPLAFLLAMQAAGMVVDYFGKSQQVRMGKLGNKVEQASINSNIINSRLESEDESLQSMVELRKNLGTQAAMFAARGSSAGPTSAIASNESVGNFNADQRMRKINQLGREANYKAQSVLSDLHQETATNDTWNQFRSSVIKNIPTSPDAWKQIKQGFSAKNGYGFGLTPVGSS